MSPFDLLFTSIAILSFLGSFSLLAYLIASERAAPRFEDSLRGLGRDSNPNTMVSIIIPARNEERDISKCLESLVTQSYQYLEIVVVDDSSEDKTLEVARKFSERSKQVKTISAGSKPKGWIGKSWPCWKGYEESKGDYLLFVDADSTLDTTLVESSLRYVQEKKIDVFSLSPKVRLHGTIARAVLPVISAAINILYPMKKVNDKKSNRAYVFGTFVMVSRKVYASFGGHEGVKEEIVEDAAIARVARASGFNLRIERGSEYISTSWESEPKSVYEGLERIISSSARAYGLISIFNAVFVFFVVLYPVFFLVFFLLVFPSDVTLIVGFIASVASAALIFTLTTLETRIITGKIGTSALLYILGCTLFISAIVTTSVKVSRGSTISWKGQKYRQTLHK
ncbi:MAG: glycosyltransferase [Nitrososphaerota archaeon]|jgi:glycosyltransferase involved in cell wall biosynthesis|nr:glycosyltransferase [Nitrososphaerota archaeon]MDG6923615.1 glycosyltransferase [Nitrososphaerota archaeon]